MHCFLSRGSCPCLALLAYQAILAKLWLTLAPWHPIPNPVWAHAGLPQQPQGQPQLFSVMASSSMDFTGWPENHFNWGVAHPLLPRDSDVALLKRLLLELAPEAIKVQLLALGGGCPPTVCHTLAVSWQTLSICKRVAMLAHLLFCRSGCTRVETTFPFPMRQERTEQRYFAARAAKAGLRGVIPFLWTRVRSALPPPAAAAEPASWASAAPGGAAGRAAADCAHGPQRPPAGAAAQQGDDSAAGAGGPRAVAGQGGRADSGDGGAGAAAEEASGAASGAGGSGAGRQEGGGTGGAGAERATAQPPEGASTRSVRSATAAAAANNRGGTRAGYAPSPMG